MAYFPCPKCGHGETNVKDVRIVREPIMALRRRRLCPSCGDRRTTFEMGPIYVCDPRKRKNPELPKA